MNASSVYLWPFFLASLGLHGFLGFILVSKSLLVESDSFPKTLTVQIIEERKAEEPKMIPAVPPRKRVENPPARVREEKRMSPPSEPAPEKNLLAHAPALPEPERPAPPTREESRSEVKEQESSLPDKVGKEVKQIDEQREKEGDGSLVKGIPNASLALEGTRADEQVLARNAPTGVWAVNESALGGWSGGGAGQGEKPGMEAALTGKLNPPGLRGEGKGRPNLSSYLATARMRIEQAKRYPREAQRKRCEGRVTLSCLINQNGEVQEIKLIQSSGYPILDEEGKATLRRASPFPSPLLIEKERLTLEIPILFKLQEKRW